jgi:mannitol/fructose-specific phosphotransferase system IIA component (Ntr-type)
MTLGDFTETSLLIPHLLGEDQAGVINALSHRLQGAGRIEDSLAFFQAVLQRDYLATSAAGNGVAFPHARLRGIERLTFAVGLSDAGIRWQDGSPVRAVFLIAVPPADVQLYLALVAGLARLARAANRLNTLTTCAMPEDVLRVLNEEIIHLPANIQINQPTNAMNPILVAGHDKKP